MLHLWSQAILELTNVGLPSSNLYQLSAGKFSPTVSQATDPVQDSAESDADAEDCSDEN